MAAILNGFLPARSKASFAEDKVLNLRWRDSTIRTPIPSAWNASHQQASTIVPRTPPQEDTKDGIFVVEDSDSEAYARDEEVIDAVPRHKTVQFETVPVFETKLPKNLDLTTNALSANSRFENRYLSPVDREVVDPILAFRERLAVTNASYTLSPVQEDFAKNGPSHRQPARLQAARSPMIGLPPTPRLADMPRGAEGVLDGMTYQHRRQGSSDNSAGGRYAVPGLRSSSQSTRDSSTGRSRNYSAGRRREPSVDTGGRRATSSEPRGRRGISANPSNRTLASSRDSSVASTFEKNSYAGLSSHPPTEQQEVPASLQSTPLSSFSEDRARFSWETDSHSSSNNSSTKTTPEMHQAPENKAPSPGHSPQLTRSHSNSTQSQTRDRPARPTIRTSSKSRGLYADMADDFRHLARDVQGVQVVSSPVHEHGTPKYPSPLESNPPNSFRPSIDTVVSNTPTSAATITPTMSSTHLLRLDISGPNPSLYPLPPSTEPSADTTDDLASADREANILEALARHHRQEAARLSALAKETKRASRKGFTVSTLIPSARRKQSLSTTSGPNSAVSADSATSTARVSSKAGLVPDTDDIWGW